MAAAKPLSDLTAEGGRCCWGAGGARWSRVKVLKQTSLQRSNTAALDEFRQEADMLQSLRHPNILNFYGACFNCHPVRASNADTDVRMSAMQTPDVVASAVQPQMCTRVPKLSFCTCAC